MKISKIVLFVLLTSVSFSYAQNKLMGKVTDYKNKPVVGAKIYLDSIYSNVETNKEGSFEVQIPEKVGTINVYSYDYGLLSSKFNNENIMDFMFLEPEKSAKARIKKNDKISIGYSEVEQKYQVSAQQGTTAATNDVSNSKYNTIFDMIRGKLAGVSVSKNNSITIRGVSSINNISEPLFVVDGMIVSTIDFISPVNVKSIKVLKGAEASIYGSQASSGVILIKTK
ncbi:TonB-dependent receptor plug domain-containing protein [Flavobacterium sp. 123]|jgi:TonB-dependent SusC/RagA subfamily outer membrane receptor|uniref:TonB-dependent receptor plug domain-containing protein n=1 Tax=Flavobacterium sp. 123 TaxID=2135627 RepID=UPI000F1FB1F5|nr:TonB-dependent receptor plug domain-containing protein [Flavobacterium sp. 123]RKT00110.1 TonB-dependent SusC/RagA subfamily outer membrane receptor [Flavobacterium sp. 123]